MGLVYDRHSVMTITMIMKMAIKRRIMVTSNELCARHWAKYNGFIYFRLIPTLYIITATVNGRSIFYLHFSETAYQSVV